MKVHKAMTKQIKTIEPTRSIRFAAQVMVKYDIGSLAVVDSFELVGIITERDILKAFAEGKNPETEVRKIMTKKVITIGPDATIEEAAKLMVKNKIKRLPVCQDNKCMGIITATDIMRHEDKLTEYLASLYLLPKKRVGAG